VVARNVRASAVSSNRVEAVVGDRGPVEHGPQGVAPLERGDDVEQRDGGQAHRRRDGEPGAILRPRHHGERAPGDEETGDAQPDPEARAITGSSGGRGRRFISPLGAPGITVVTNVHLQSLARAPSR
jgi:hypothetical protein